MGIKEAQIRQSKLFLQTSHCKKTVQILWSDEAATQYNTFKRGYLYTVLAISGSDLWLQEWMTWSSA